MEDPPPSYNAVTSQKPTEEKKDTPNPVAQHQARNGIPIHSRRSMEDEARSLPDGWVRQYDDKQHHQFFVDTQANPPRSIWQHPFDDQQYLSSLDPKERARLQGNPQVPSHADIVAESSDEEDQHYHGKDRELPPRPEQEPTGISRFGRKMKDKITNTTHEQRDAERQKRAEAEQRMYERHQRYRAAMVKAAQTGKPQLVGQDKEGKDVFIEPPSDRGLGGGYGYSRGGYGYSPYTQGPYSTPNSRYASPSSAYSRPYYGGYGGGLGLPIGLGLGGGLLMDEMMMGGMGGMGGMGMGGMGMGMGGMGMGMGGMGGMGGGMMGGGM